MRLALFLLLATACTSALASPYFVGNPYSPVPPTCIVNPHPSPIIFEALNGNAVRVWNGEVRLARADDPQLLWHFPTWGSRGATANLEIYRVACAEPGQSALVANFYVPSDAQRETARYVLPRAIRDYNGFGGPEFTFSTRAGSGAYAADAARDGNIVFGDFLSTHDGVGWFQWTYIIDVARPRYDGWDIDSENYNGSFYLDLFSTVTNQYIPIPSTSSVLSANSRLPLGGRLSGIWVVDGASDQGLLLWVSTRVPPADAPVAATESTPLLMALTWFTFDADGNELWLTGAAEFPQGATEVELVIDRTQAGEFLGATPAARSQAGTARLTGMSCNDLRLEWYLAPLGLGTGTQRLRRYEALEVAGYSCRDYEARQRSLAQSDTP